ncbi:MAG TPA: hypothetical protein VEL74_22440, partial [Thermoanaerobaculia bacterium]|nr:hypothetical protein [Thermoanaerobaculia bacterium]
MTRSSYDLHGLRLAINPAQASDGETMETMGALQARLASLPPADGADGGGGPPDLLFEIHTVSGGREHGLARPAAPRPVYDPPLGEVVYDDGGDILYIEHGPRLRVLAEPGLGRVRVSAHVSGDTGDAGDADGSDVWLLSHPLFTVPLAELLKRRGLYSLHAAGLCLDGRALVLPGTSGSGKSTLALALVRAGFGFLGDDTLFLSRKAEGLRLLAFPDELDLTDQTVGFFPELAPLLAEGARPGWRKRQLRAEEAYGAQVVWECAPGALVFPRVAGRQESVLTPIDPGEALLELVPNVLLTEPASSQ